MTTCRSVFRRRHVGEVQDRFGKGEFQHNLAGLVGHFEDRFQKTALGAFGLQQFPDHGARDFPGPIGITQLFAFGIGDQLIADSGIEEIARHGSKSTSG
jgi:hypothetical protein